MTATFTAPKKKTKMAISDKLVKIADYTGLYLKDDDKLFVDLANIEVVNIQKKIKPPYTIVVRFYDGKKAVYKQYHIINMTKTVKRICDEISAERQIQQIEKSFKSRQIEKTLNQIFDEWIEFRRHNISEHHYKSTISSYNAHIRDVIGKLNIKKITTKQIQKIVNDLLAGGKAPRTTKTIKDILSPIFEYSIKNSYCEHNKAKDVEIVKFDNKKYFTIEIDKARELYEKIINYHNPVIRCIFIFLLHGRRKNEILKLKWENINLSQNLYFLADKDNKSRKQLTFPLRELQVKALEDIGIKQKGYIFLKEDGTIYSDLKYQWNQIKQQLNFDIKLHDLRHLIGFIAVNAGVSLELISKTLGHSNAQITQRYSNVKIQGVEDTLNTVFNVLNLNNPVS